MTPRRFRSAVAVLTATATLVVLVPAAGAHADLDAEPAVGGTPAQLRLHVPNERSDAATVRIELRFTDGDVWSAVSAPPTGAWAPTVTAAGIAWEGGRLEGSQAADLAFTATLPAAGGELVVPVLQTYDDGEVVRWIDPPGAGGGAPDHPAPVLAIAPGTAPPPTTAAPTTATPETSAAVTTAPSTVPRGPSTTETPAGDGGATGTNAALVVGVLVGVAAGVALAVRRRRG